MADEKIINKKQRALKKMSFYDTNFKVLGISVIAAVVSVFLLGSIGEDISLLFAFITIIPFLIINWGMFYHQFKSGSYGWFSISLILLIIGLAPISLMSFYWIKMRKEFKSGKGVYS